MKRTLRWIVLAALAATGALSSLATDLRGRVDGTHPYAQRPFPAAGMNVMLCVPGPQQWSVLTRTVTARDGMYYFRGIRPGDYILVVNNVTFPLRVFPTPNQDVPPVLVPVIPPR